MFDGDWFSVVKCLCRQLILFWVMVRLRCWLVVFSWFIGMCFSLFWVGVENSVWFCFMVFSMDCVIGLCSVLISVCWVVVLVGQFCMLMCRLCLIWLIGWLVSWISLVVLFDYGDSVFRCGIMMWLIVFLVMVLVCGVVLRMWYSVVRLGVVLFLGCMKQMCQVLLMCREGVMDCRWDLRCLWWNGDRVGVFLRIIMFGELQLGNGFDIVLEVGGWFWLGGVWYLLRLG